MDKEISLKAILMELGNRLVTEYGYSPASPEIICLASGYLLAKTYSTDSIVVLTDFINYHPEAQQVLADMGIEWEM